MDVISKLEEKRGKKQYGVNTTPKGVLLNSLYATIGLFFFAFGVYLTIQANIGAAPWDAFALGFTNTFGIKYGNASILISLAILGIDIWMKEPIGIGMVLDAILVGKFVDLFNYMNAVHQRASLLGGVITMVIGFFIMGFSQHLYMAAALGCGPRDTLLVGLKRHLPRIPIGLISVMILAVCTFVGWRMGAKIGIGTLMAAFLEGPVMQLDFHLVGYVPTETKHQNIIESFKILTKKDAQ